LFLTKQIAIIVKNPLAFKKRMCYCRFDGRNTMQILSLTPGTRFHLPSDIREGVFVEQVGLDAKVEFDGRAVMWSGGTSVVPVNRPQESTPATSTNVVAEPEPSEIA
jgi:hypothetical protein